EVADMDPDPMLHFACPQLVQKRSPTVVLFQIFSHTFGDEDVTGITTIHHSLRQVDPGAGNVLPLVYVSHFADRTAVNPHSQGDPRMFFQGPGNFYGALRRCLGAFPKDQRHTVACGQAGELLLRVGLTKLAGAADDLVELVL